MPMHSCMAT